MRVTKLFQLSLGGFLYGLGLTVFGVLMAGAGHGTYLLLGIASAPLSLLGVLVSIGAPPLLWCAVGLLLAYTGKSPQKQLLVAVMMLHYVGIYLVSFSELYSEGKYLKRAWELNSGTVLAAGAFYLAGQLLIWFLWIINSQRTNSQRTIEQEGNKW